MAVVGGPSAWLALAALVGLAFGAGWFAGARGRAAGRAPVPVPVPAPAPAVDVPADAPAPAAAAAVPPGLSSLGRYRIERELGRGSMGTVYLGHDPQIGRRVALKTMALSREFAGTELDEARQRFFREAETAGQLRHPDIVTIFDADEADGLAYIAMEFIAGHDLLRYTVPGRLLPVETVLATIARVAEALAHAHTRGVVHRDVKPANVMVDPAAGIVKVTDFGIARIGDASRTRTGLVLGTPSFMSPEQMAGRRLDGRSDLYAVGVVLFQLLTGALPHRADGMAELMRQIVNDVAPDVRSLRPGLPEALANVVALALEKRPEVRYADGCQLADDLRAVARMMGSSPTPEAPPADPPGTPGFEATTPFSPDDPRHNARH